MNVVKELQAPDQQLPALVLVHPLILLSNGRNEHQIPFVNGQGLQGIGGHVRQIEIMVPVRHAEQLKEDLSRADVVQQNTEFQPAEHWTTKMRPVESRDNSALLLLTKSKQILLA